MKPIILVVILILAAGCQRGKGPEPGDAAQPTPVTPPPEEGPRAACPADTEMQGGPEQFQEWCQKEDGTLQGRFTIWHKNRYKAAQGDYAQNLKQGRWTYWHPNGQKASSGEYVAGKRHGDWTFWHENGKPAEQGGYQNGLEDGNWTSYDEDGNKTTEIKYQNGMQLHR